MRACDASTSATARAAAVAARQHGEVLRVAGEGHSRAGAPLKRAVAGSVSRSPSRAGAAGHGALGRGDAGLRQQPAGEQRLGQRQRRRRSGPPRAARQSHRPMLGAGAAQLPRAPRRASAPPPPAPPGGRLPGVVLGPVDGLRIAQVAEDTRRRLGDHAVTGHTQLPTGGPSYPGVSSPTTAAVIMVDSVPEIIVLAPRLATSARRSGTIAAMPPIMMPRLPKLAKPHRA